MAGLCSRPGERGANVVFLQFRVVLKDFRMAGTVAQQVENVHDPEPQTPDAGPTSAFARLYGDALEK